MKKPIDLENLLKSRAGENHAFRQRLVTQPRDTLEKELGVKLDEGCEIHVHEETESQAHLVLPPKDKLSAEERQEAKTGATSLEFLRKTMHDPAPPIRPPTSSPVSAAASVLSPATLAKEGTESVRRGLDFLESSIDENGAWHCIRFNVADPNIPRHYEKPPFISALCLLALSRCNEPRTKAMCARTRSYLVDTMEYPGFWRYYRHLPQDLDSTTLCSMAIRTHPWIVLGRNVHRMLANRDEEGRFMTWVLEDDGPGVVAQFRIEADPVVNANVVAYLGDHPETEDAQRWLETLITNNDLDKSSKWYPDVVTILYATTRAMIRVQPALDRLRPILVDRILGLRENDGEFGDILQAAQAVAALKNIGRLDCIDAKRHAERLISTQDEDGSWPELLMFGDQSLNWGVVGQIGHGSESVTTAFCVEALESLTELLRL